MNEFDFTTIIPQVDLFSFVFGKNQGHKNTISKLTDLQNKKAGLS